MGKFIKISEKHQEYLINNPNEKHIVDVKLNSGKHLRRRRVNDCSLLELNDDENISLEDIKYLTLHRDYESKKTSSRRYNANLSTIQISRTLHKELKEYLHPKSLSIREWIEKLIIEKIKDASTN